MSLAREEGRGGDVMELDSKSEHEVYRIIDRKDGTEVGVYSRAYHNEYDFGSAAEARNANVHGIYKDRKAYAIAKYRVIYELIEPDVDA